MKWLMFVLSIALSLCAMDENDVARDIASTRDVEVLSAQMQNAPKEYRHRYLEAIKTLVAEENEARRSERMHALTGRSGGNGGGSGGAGSGSGGGGKGGGGGGGGKGGR